MATRKIGNININYTVPEAQTQIYNALGRDAGQDAYVQGEANPNFFQKRWNSIKNAFGSTGAAIASAIKDSSQNTNTDLMLQGNQGRMQNIVRKYGYNSLDDYYNALDDAEVNDKAKYNELLNTVQAELKDQSAANMEAMKKNQADYKDWVDNNYVSNQLKQDRGKFAGSAINTLSTAVDLTGLSATPIANSIQGGIEGVADELEQNGLENFDSKRAGQNAVIGATTGLVTGALNKGISNKLAKNGGNLFKGNNALTKGLNSLGSKTALGRGVSTIATGAGRGAISGAVGGATGAGLSAAMNNGDVIQSALQGAKQGAVSGATTGGIMAGANMAISKTPGVGKFYNDLQSAKTRWDQSGDTFNERLTNTINSGESGVGNWLNRRSNSKLLNSLGDVGNSIQDVSGAIPSETPADANEIEIAYNEGALTPKELVEAYDRGEISEIALTRSWDRSNEAARGAINNALGSSKRWNSSTSANTVRLYRGLEQEYDPNYPSSRLDTNGYESWTDNPELAKQYGEKVYYIDVPENDIKNSYIDENPDSPTYGDRYPLYKTTKSAGLNGVNGNEYHLEVGSDYQKRLAYRPLEETTTPTTAKGWVKRAGERIVENANDRGVGLGIKNVADEMPEDVRNLKINDWNDSASLEPADNLDVMINRITPKEDGRHGYNTLEQIKTIYDSGDQDAISRLEQAYKNANEWGTLATAKREIGYNPTTARTQAVQGDAWDRLAQQSGYNSYDDVIAAYRQANPNTELNPNGAAGQILSWLDENPNTPTTAGEWAKRAGQRIVEDANERGVGLGIRNVSQESPETEIYRRLTGQTSAVDNEGDSAESIYGSSNLGSRKQTLREKIGLALERSQVGATRKETRDIGIKDAGEVVDNVRRRTGLVDLEDQSRFAQEITGGKNSLLDTIQNDAMSMNDDGSTRMIDLTDLDSQIRRIIDDAPDTQINLNKKQEILSGIQREMTNPGVTAVQKANNMRASASQLYNKNARTPDKADVAEGNIYSEVANLIENKVYDSIPKEKVDWMFDTAISEANARSKQLASKGVDAYAKAYAKLADDLANTDRSIKNFRSAKKDFVDVNKLATKTSQGNTAWNNTGLTVGTAITAAALSGNPLVAIPSAAAAKLLAPAVGEVATKGAAKLGGKLVDWGRGSSSANSTVNTQPTNTNYNPATNIYNAIARTEGLTNGEQARTANYLVDAVQEAEVVPNTSANSLEALVSPTATSTTSVYDSVYGSPVATTTALQESPRTGYFQTTGDYWTDLIASAMSSAIDDNNATAFASLYAMYQDALSNLEKQSSSSSSEQKLTATQQRANAAMNSLERLAGMTPDLGYNLSNIPVVGDIATFGGNDYESEAKSLAQQIGYMVSGSNIKDNEAEAIGKAYVPQPFDNEQTRQNKLRRAYEIISQYQNGYSTI